MRFTPSKSPIKRLLQVVNYTVPQTVEEMQLTFGDPNVSLELNIDNDTLDTLIIISLIIGIIFTIISLAPYKSVFVDSKFCSSIMNMFRTKSTILPLKKAKESPYIGPQTPIHYKQQQLNNTGQNIVFRVRTPTTMKLPEAYKQDTNYETQYETRITIITKVENGTP